MNRFVLLRLPLVALVAAFNVVGCDCGVDPITKIAPEIYMDVCAKPQRTVNGVNIGGFEECAVDFGARDISVKVTKNIKVTNPSSVALTLKNVEIIGDPSFKIELAPQGDDDQIAPGLSGDIVISVRPNTETAISAKLYVHSDANNTEQTPNSESLIEIPLTANGVDNGVPDIEVTPLACDFGRTAVGGVQLCPVQVKNTGNRGLVLDSVDFVAVGDDPNGPIFQVPPESTTETPFAFTGRPPTPDEEIPPTVAPELPVIIQVRFTPDVLGNFQGRVRILSNDPDESSIDVTLSGVSVTPPTCEAHVKSINGADVPAGSNPEIQPLDDVVVTLAGSEASTSTGSISSFAWQDPPGRPAGSTIRIANPTAAETGFTFADTVGVDLAGDYKICGQVFDDLGTGSVNECCVQFNAIPKQHFLVQLSWDTDVNDIDLHVAKVGSTGKACIESTTFGTVIDSSDALMSFGGESDDFDSVCDEGLDCNYASCKTSSFGTPPEWDGVAGRSIGDPTLDIDDIDGFGPENINVDIMPGGDYVVGVNAYSTSIPAGCTVRIFVFGQLAGEFFNEVNRPDWWEVALVHWPDDIETGHPCVEDLTDGDATDDCGAP